MTLGEYIKTKRLKLGFTQSELAERLGYAGKAAICNIEHNNRIPPAWTWDNFCEVLKCSTRRFQQLAVLSLKERRLH